MGSNVYNYIHKGVACVQYKDKTIAYIGHSTMQNAAKTFGCSFFTYL